MAKTPSPKRRPVGKKKPLVSLGMGRTLFPLLCVLVCGGVPTLLYRLYYPSAPVTAARHFLELVGNGKGQDALLASAKGFRKQRSPASLGVEAKKKWGMDSYSSSSWPEVTIEANRATLEGTVTTKKGDTIPMTVHLIREQDEWRVSEVVVRAEPPEDTEAVHAKSSPSE
jgi:hypothetical protein